MFVLKCVVVISCFFAWLRFVPRHEDELELDVNDPLLVLVEDEDFWYEGFNMRTGERGIFPAYYATEVFKEPEVALKSTTHE